MDDEGWRVVKPFLALHPMNYAVVLPTKELAHDYPIGPMPVTLLIDRGGRIAAWETGVVNQNSFEETIKKLLKARS